MTLSNKMKALRRKSALGEAVIFAYQAFRANRLRVSLTALGMAIGTASVILVVTVGMTGREFLVRLIESIGSNEIWAEYEAGGQRITGSSSDFLTIEDMQAVRSQVEGIVAATPVVTLGDRISFGGAKQRDITILGVYPDYWIIRNLVSTSGRFLDLQDEQTHSKACVITVSMALQLYGSPDAAIGHSIAISGLPFVVVGTFKERVDTFGQTEVTDNTMVIPFSVSRYFTETGAVKLLYFSVSDPSMVPEATAKIKKVIETRHRPDSVYEVTNLSQLVVLANRVADTLTIILLVGAAVTLVVGGVGIMNIMLATVSARVREIGIRKAIGATNSDILWQFLSEAIAISLIGGLVGVFTGLAIPYSFRFLTDYRVPVSGKSAFMGIAVCFVVGVLFGTIPATRAAQMNPIDSIRSE